MSSTKNASTTTIPIVQLLSSETLQHRLWVGLGNKGGARGSLTRCVGKLAALKKRSLSQSSNDSDSSSAAAATAELERELALLQLDLQRSCHTWRRLETEVQAEQSKHLPLDKQIAHEMAAVQQLQQQWQQTSAAAACQDEYEALAKQAI
jgi:hypothetical protein